MFSMRLLGALKEAVALLNHITSVRVGFEARRYNIFLSLVSLELWVGMPML